MKIKNLLLFVLSCCAIIIIAVCAVNFSGCGLLNFGTDNNQSVKDKLGGEVLGVMAYYLDDRGNIIYNQGNFKNITYGEEFDLKQNIEVRAVGKMGKYAVLQEKTGKADGYTLKIKKYNADEDICLDGIPSKYEWASYTFEFYYGEFSDELRLNVERADFLDCGCELIAPELTYNENFKTPYIKNLPENDDVTVELYYEDWSTGKVVWKEWDFPEDEKNTEFLPGVVDIKAVLSAPNYFGQEFNATCKINRYSLKNHLELSGYSMEMQYLIKSFSGEEVTLSKYNPLLEKYLTASFEGEEITGTFEFVNGTDVVSALGNKNLKIKFTNPQTDIYLGEEHVFDLDVSFTKFKVEVPTVYGNTISNIGTDQMYMPSSHKFEIEDEDIYNLYYRYRDVVFLEFERQYYPGTYPCAIVLADKDKCEWVHGGTEDIQTTWTLNKGYIDLSLNVRFDTLNSTAAPRYEAEKDTATQTYSLNTVLNVVSGEIPTRFYAYKKTQRYNEGTGTVYYTWVLVDGADSFLEINEEDAYKMNGYSLSEEGIAEATQNGYAVVHAKIKFSQARYTTSITEIDVTLRVSLPS